MGIKLDNFYVGYTAEYTFLSYMLLNSNILDKFKIYRDDVSSGNRPVESAIVDI